MVKVNQMNSAHCKN